MRCCLGPKRAGRISKLHNLSREDDVCWYVVRKPQNKAGKKPRAKAPKTQCLVTPHILQTKSWCIALKQEHTEKNKEQATESAKLLAKRMKEAKEKNSRNRLPRDVGCSLRELLSLSLNLVKNEIF